MKTEMVLFFSFISLFFLLIGVVLNFVVMTNNQGLMPVYTSYDYETSSHLFFDNPSEVDYFILADIFPVLNYKASIGDFFLFIGGLSLVFCSSVYCFLKYKNAK